MKTTQQELQTLGVIVNVSSEQTPLGIMHTMTVKCNKEQTQEVIDRAVKMGMPHERFNGGVNIYAWS